jgi:hypothetical protein
MTNKPAAIPEQLKPWIEAKKRHRLSQAHIQMARELGMNPRKFGKIDNHRQEPWKAPLPIFIETLYFERFGKTKPDKVRSFIEMATAAARKKREKQLAKERRGGARASSVLKGSPDKPGLLPQNSEAEQNRNNAAAASSVDLFGPISKAAGAS